MQLLGVIENMTSEVFGSGGGERLAAELGVPLLGSVPLDARHPRVGRRGRAARALGSRTREPARAIVEIARRDSTQPRGAGFTRTLPLVS